MFGWLKRDPKKKLEQAYARKLEEARDVQRSGDIVRYSELMAEAELLMRLLDDHCGDCSP